MVKLIIDNRESIKNKFDELDNVEIKSLLIGDYQFLIDNQIFVIIERKTISDYAASIKDGRLREQKKRLMANVGNAFILYLVEGDLTKNNSSYKYNKVDKNTIISSIVNTMIRDNINVFHTSNKDETIFFLKSLLTKFEKQGKSFINNKTKYSEDFVNCSKVKSANMTPDICFQMILNCIPTISNKISERLVSKFSNLYNFILYMEEIDSENRLEEIINIRMDDNDKSRKISKTAAKNIITYLGF